MVNRRNDDALTVAPPIDTWISTTHAWHCLTRELEHVVKRCDLRLVGDFKDLWLIIRLGMAEPSSVAYNDTVSILNDRPEILVDQKAEESRGKIQQGTCDDNMECCKNPHQRFANRPPCALSNMRPTRNRQAKKRRTNSNENRNVCRHR